MNKEKLKARIGEIQTRREEIKAKGDAITTGEADEFKALVLEQEKLMEEIDIIDRADRLDARATAPQPIPSGFNVAGGPAAQEPHALGKYLQAVAVLSSNDEQRFMSKTEARKIMAAASGLNESVPADGGFLVGTQQASMLEQRAYDEGKLVKLCEHIPISGPFNGLEFSYVDETSRANGSRQGGVRVYRTAEAPATLTDAAPKFGKTTLKLENLTGLCYVTEEELQDAATLEALIVAMFGREFGFKNDDELINGTGAGQMLGILNAPCLVSVAKETGQSAATINFENVTKMYARFWSGSSLAKSRWVVNRAAFPQLMSLNVKVGTGGIPVYIPGNNIAGTPYGSLYGIPVEFAEQSAALGTVGDIILADFSQYRIIEKGGLQAMSSIHVKFDTTGETAFRFRMRNNGQPLWKSVLTPYKGSDTVSPFVALATR